jgi:vacuolar-type H+-ATPase subunit F/Vma7
MLNTLSDGILTLQKMTNIWVYHVIEDVRQEDVASALPQQAGLILRTDDTILFTHQQVADIHEHRWIPFIIIVPIESGETAKEALRNNVEQEFGILVTITRFLGQVRLAKPTVIYEGNIPNEEHVFRDTLKTRFRWIPITHIQDFATSSAIEKILSLIRQSRHS